MEAAARPLEQRIIVMFAAVRRGRWQHSSLELSRSERIKLGRFRGHKKVTHS